MAISVPTKKLSFIRFVPSSPSIRRNTHMKPGFCSVVQPALEQVREEIICQQCSGTGWMLCDYCKGQKTNVKSETNRIYRRCPSCRAVGYVLCQKCKVYKCVTFPDYSDELEMQTTLYGSHVNFIVKRDVGWNCSPT